MTQSTILPPTAAKPAEVAAPASADPNAGGADAANGSGGPTFDQVLKSQMDKSQEGADAPTDATDGAAMDAAATAMILAQLEAGDARQAATALLPAMMSRIVTTGPAVPVVDKGDKGVTGVTSAQKGAKDVSVIEALKGGSTESRQVVDTTGEDDLREFVARIESEQTRDPQGVRRTGLRGLGDGTGDAGETRHADKSTARIEGAQATPVAPVEAKRAQDAAPLRLTVSQPVGSTGWDEAVADRITWLAQARQPTAELQLNPPNLGPVEVRVSMSGDQATVSFFSPHAPVREALQGSMPRLSEAFAASGISLGDVFVGADSRSNQQQGRQQERRGRDESGANDRVGAVGASVSRWTSGLSGSRAVDLFA